MLLVLYFWFKHLRKEIIAGFRLHKNEDPFYHISKSSPRQIFNSFPGKEII